jgi:hypothetical protein
VLFATQYDVREFALVVHKIMEEDEKTAEILLKLYVSIAKEYSYVQSLIDWFEVLMYPVERNFVRHFAERRKWDIDDEEN